MRTLYPYQQKVLEFMENNEKTHITTGGMLCLDMGLGKSICSLGLIFKHVKKIKKTLIVVPKSLLHNWEQEYIKYQKGREQIKFKTYYNVNLKECSFNENIILTTYDMIRLKFIFSQHYYDRIILDESQNIRNHKNIINKAVVELGNHSKKKWCLSGTPFFNNYMDMYSQCLFIGVSPFNIKNKWKKPTEEFLKEFRQDFCYIKKKKEVLTGDEKLKPIIHHNIKTELNNTENNIYNKFKQYLNVGNNSPNKTNHLNYLIKIRQSCCNIKVLSKINNCCSLCSTKTKNEFKCNHYLCNKCIGSRKLRKTLKKTKCYICKIDSTKFDKIKEIIDNVPDNDKIVIFTQWKTMAVELKKFLKKFNIKTHNINGSVHINERNNIIESFKTDSKRILLATIQTCGTGINLTIANHVILLDNWWNSSLENQAIDRLYRIGQLKEVNVYHITIKNTVERWINFKQRQKNIQSSILLEKNNKEYKMIGESYGIYQTSKKEKIHPDKIKRKQRFYSDSKMSKLSMSSCLGREKLYTYNVNPLLWIKRQSSARIIQKFFKSIVISKQFSKNRLTDILNKDVAGIICEYIFLNPVYTPLKF